MCNVPLSQTQVTQTLTPNHRGLNMLAKPAVWIEILIQMSLLQMEGQDWIRCPIFVRASEHRDAQVVHQQQSDNTFLCLNT